MASQQASGAISGAASGAAAGTLIFPGWGTVIGGALGAVGGLLGSGKKPKIPQYPKIDINAVQAAAVTGNQANLPALEKLGAEVNRFNAEQARAALEMNQPGRFAQASDIVGSQLRGEVPSDVSGYVQRQAAAQALGLGVGGSGIQANITARDLGLTSLAIQQQGLQNFGNLAGMVKTPQFDVGSMFLTPAQRLTAELAQQQPQFQRDLLNAQIKAAPSPADVALGSSVQQFGNFWAGINAQNDAFNRYSTPPPVAASKPVYSWTNWGGGPTQFGT